MHPIAELLLPAIQLTPHSPKSALWLIWDFHYTTRNGILPKSAIRPA